MRLWLIEDDLDLLAALAEALQREGHRVVALSDASGASDSAFDLDLPRLDVEVIVIDQRLPSTTGLDMLKRIRNAGCAAPAVLISAYADEGLRRTAMHLDGCELLAKPFTLEALLQSIDRAVAKRYPHEGSA